MKQFNLSFNPTDLDRLGRYGSIYHSLMVSAPWGRITVSPGDALINSKFSSLTVAAPTALSGRTLRGHRRVLRLSSGTKVVPDPTKPGSYAVAFHAAAAH